MHKIVELIPWWPFPTAVMLASLAAYFVRWIFANDPVAAKALREVLFDRRKPLVQSYVRSLAAALDATRFILYPIEKEPNRRRHWLQLYGIFCSVAIFYTVVFYFISWAVGGGEVIGGRSLIAHEYTIIERILISFSFVAILVFGVRTVVNSGDFQKTVIDSLPWVSDRRQLKFTLSVFSWAVMLVVFYQSTDRNILASVHGQSIDTIKVVIALSMSTCAAIIIWLDDLPLIPFALIITAAFCQHFGVPIAIVIPAAVAIATLEVGLGPLLASLIIVPAAMAAYYIFGAPEADTTIMYLAALALFPIYCAVLLTRRRYFGTLAAISVSLIMFVPAFVPVIFTTSQINDLLGYSIIVLWVAIPLINALFDAGSWFASWHLLQHLREQLDEKVGIPRNVNRRGRRPKDINIWKPISFLVVAVVHVLIDVVLAMVFLVLVFAFSMAAIMVANSFARVVRPEYVVDTAALVEGFIRNPMSGDGFWITMIVVSTLMPTILHFLFASSALVTVVTSPRALRDSLDVLKERPSDPEDAGKTRERKEALFRVQIYSGAFFFTILLLMLGTYFLFETMLGWQSPLGVFAEIERFVARLLGI